MVITNYRVRTRNENNRTEIIPISFRSEKEAQEFIDEQNRKLIEKHNGVLKWKPDRPGIIAYEMASSQTRCY